MRFPGLPVAGRTYVLKPHEEGDGTPEEEHAVMQYSEQYTVPNQLRVWSATDGTIRVNTVTADHIAGSFQATLEPANSSASNTLRITGGEFVTKYEIPGT